MYFRHAPAFFTKSVSPPPRFTSSARGAVTVLRGLVGAILLAAGTTLSAQTLVPFLHMEFIVPLSALVTEGAFPRNLDGTPIEYDEPPSQDFFASITAGSYVNYAGQTRLLEPPILAGDFLLGAAKDSNFAAHARLSVLGETGTLAPYGIGMLLNSRERISLAIETTPDGPEWVFMYGTKVALLPVQQVLPLQYGGWVMRPTLDSLVGNSYSGVRFEITTRYYDLETGTVIPEPAAFAVWVGGAILLVATALRRRPGARN